MHQALASAPTKPWSRPVFDFAPEHFGSAERYPFFLRGAVLTTPRRHFTNTWRPICYSEKQCGKTICLLQYRNIKYRTYLCLRGSGQHFYKVWWYKPGKYARRHFFKRHFRGGRSRLRPVSSIFEFLNQETYQMKNWANKNVLVTGGASFIGSHLVEALVSRGAKVRVADNLSSGKLRNLSAVLDSIEFLKGDLKKWDFALKSSKNCEVVFHLAADHGGRGYISTHPANCITNMALDNIVFETAVKNKVERITFASSACVYPTDIQEGKVLLQEEMVSFTKRGGAFADEEYGWAKLAGELSLRAFQKQYGIKASSVRIFTAYGPRENESHAIIALIAKAFIQQTPFEIWGDGEQTRNFTYVADIVSALILASEYIEDGSAVNAGIRDFISLNQAAQEVFKITGWYPPNGIKYLSDQPAGVKHRAADYSRITKICGWKPGYSFSEGLKQTVNWYLNNNTPKSVRENLRRLLMER